MKIPQASKYKAPIERCTSSSPKRLGARACRPPLSPQVTEISHEVRQKTWPKGLPQPGAFRAETGVTPVRAPLGLASA